MSANLHLAARPPTILPANLHWLAQHAQFVLCDFVPDEKRPGKTNKRPISPQTLTLCSAHDPANWMACDTAVAKANELNGVGQGVYGIGFVLTPELGIWCLDIDNGTDASGQWTQGVQALFAQLPGVAWEYSHSGRGLHGWGRSSTIIPAHETRHENAALGLYLELYSRKRFIALGTAAACEMQPTQTLPAELTKLFPLLGMDDAAALDAEWTDQPHPMWHGPTDDDALLTIALKSRSNRGMMFPKLVKATFKQLWEPDYEALCKHYPGADGGYDESAVDQALACHLAFWTGNNWTRIAALMERSGLHRPKHERPDYLHRTIGKACMWQKEFYNDGKGVVSGAPIPESAKATGISLDDFYAYLPQKSYIFVPNRDLWVASGVDEAVPEPDGMKPSAWLARARPVHQMTWAPGQPLIIPNRLVASGGWIEKDGANTFNLYKPPVIQPGDPAQAGPWLQLLQYLFPSDAEHVVKWFAHRRQRPGDKVNHALVLGGPPRIGKDTICEPLKHGVGPWNFKEIAPRDLLEPFNPHVKSVVLRVSEARDSGDMNRYAMYDHCKTLLAVPPDVLSCNEKNLRQHDVFNVMGVIFTTNYEDGLYLPTDDGRHYVMWSERERTDFQEGYWRQLYAWYEAGGLAHVVAYLDAVDLSAFDPKRPPDKTPAFWRMVNAGRAPEEGELSDALEKLGNPPATAVTRLLAVADGDFQKWLVDRANRKQLQHRMKSVGYTAVPNAADKNDGQWRVDQKRQTVYARKDLSEGQRLEAASALCKSPPLPPRR